MLPARVKLAREGRRTREALSGQVYPVHVLGALFSLISTVVMRGQSRCREDCGVWSPGPSVLSWEPQDGTPARRQGREHTKSFQ